MRHYSTGLFCWFLWVSSPLQADTVGYYRFEEDSGGTALDSSGNGNHGTLMNGVARSADVPNSLVPQTLHLNTASGELDGTDDVIVVPDAPSLRPETGLTIEGWVRPTGSAWVLIGKQWGSGCCANSYQIEINPFRFQLTDPSGNSFLFAAPMSPTPDEWHHVAATWDGATVRLYLDGEEVAAEAYDGAIGYDANPVLIGADDDGGGIPGCCFYQGHIDEVRISDVALSPGQFLSDFPCPALNVLGELVTDMSGSRIAGTLYEFRDTVLAGSRSGRSLTALYYRYAVEGNEILSRSPALRAESLEVLRRFEPLLAEASQGRPAVISREEFAQVDHLLRAVGKEAGPGLALVVSYLRLQLRREPFLSQFGITRGR